LSADNVASLRNLLGIQQVDSNPVDNDEVYFAEKDSSVVRLNITVQVDADNVSDNEYAPFDQDDSVNYEHAGVQFTQTYSCDFLSKGFSQAHFDDGSTKSDQNDIFFYIWIKLIALCQY
jgi:hypothetical protein